MKRRFKKSSYFPCNLEQLEQDLKDQYFQASPDLASKIIHHDGKRCIVVFIDYLVDKDHLYDQIVGEIQHTPNWDHETFKDTIPVTGSKQHTELNPIGDELLEGAACVYVEGERDCLTFLIPRVEKREPDRAETESLIFGPKVSFTESMDTNLNLVHKRMDTSSLKVEKFVIGNTVPTEVRMVYLEDLANEDNVKELRDRLSVLNVDDVLDASTLTQYIEDNSYSIFPQFITTELPDRFCYSLKEGRLGILVDKSASGVVTPASFFSFFQTTEDNYTRWNMGAFTRLLRIIAMFISITLTPTYVAALTYHYEIIPDALLVSLGHSRTRVPFPPLLEALILEFLIELIREAGARLPTKVGQTMGIVGGIVIGQAVVQAGFTSNILIIIVALSALASFTTPSYLMGSAIRIIRFPLMIFAGLWGFVGLVFSFAFLAIHLVKQRSLNRPYFVPVYPFQPRDFDNSIFRIPYLHSNKRAYSNKPKKIQRFPKPKKHKKSDIDE
ncbi:spore germination protein [Alkalibacillus haloalkaliphilus]|uniref:spore germination protein n=1 Tax=Alkalibacillus haloalkaliphilus TaxID=94136 RepID=UPI0029367F0D|nr:spore germination protein [Alkalibacillus haloalkaliphilus]MDV2582479.1 spore germination protein [Alkalibacillus haloalkaliphilus]